MIRLLPDSLASLFYPRECGICSGPVESLADGAACDDCWKTTKIFDENETLCIKCGAFLFAGNAARTASCHRCEDHEYDGAVAAGLYEKALMACVLDLKRTPHVPGRLRTILTEVVKRLGLGPNTLIIPVPLSARRMHERGFNQAAVIGKFVAKTVGLRFDESSLIREVHTPMHRVGMDRKARALTVKRAFAVVRPKLIKDQDILLVDDILTSGATASACASILKKNGAATVRIMTIARAA